MTGDSSPPALHYDVHPGEGPCLLLVHGFLSSRAQWLDNLAGLAAFCRPVTVELWGHGRSPAPEDPAAYTVEAYVEQFERIRRALGADRWFVCGQSFGAGLTIRYALAHAPAVAGQIVTNSMSAFRDPVVGDPAERETSARAIVEGGAEAVGALRFHPRFSRRLGPRVTQGMTADAELLSPLGIANAMRRTTPDLAVGPALGDLAVPTLVINGTWEKAFQPLRAALPGRSPVIEVADVAGGHSINAEAPDAFDGLVGDFIRRLGDHGCDD